MNLKTFFINTPPAAVWHNLHCYVLSGCQSQVGIFISLTLGHTLQFSSLLERWQLSTLTFTESSVQDRIWTQHCNSPTLESFLFRNFYSFFSLNALLYFYSRDNKLLHILDQRHWLLVHILWKQLVKSLSVLEIK